MFFSRYIAKFVTFTALFFASTLCFAQQKISVEQYIAQYADMAIDEMKQYGIPASITMAQGMLESGNGNGRLAREANNHFGIKCKSDWTGKRIYHDDDAKGECFRKYKNAEESFRDHSVFLRDAKRYASLFKLRIDDYRGWAHGLKAAGYATNPQYAQLLINLIEKYNLERLDSGAGKGRKHRRHANETAAEVVIPATGVGVAVEAGKAGGVMMANGLRYVVIRGADSFTSISKKTGISVKKLLKYNEYSYAQNLELGTRIYLDRKRLSSDEAASHIMKQGETLHSVAQRYGVTVKSLRQRNNIRKDNEPRVGQKVRLR